jgi:hypothetical protein
MLFCNGDGRKRQLILFSRRSFRKMFCPQCGQQQITGETRFCSRCGFPLSGVLALLANGGVPAQSETSVVPKQLSPRSRGYRQGALLILIGVVLTPILGILTDIGLSEVFPALAAVICFMGGFTRMLYARMFEEKTPQHRPDSLPSYIPPAGPAAFGAGSARPAALPPQRSVPAPSWRRPNDTADLAQPPPSVTENTTRLLDDRADPPKS